MRPPRVGFLTSAVRLEQLPSLPYPEVAFAGRSNVGKSSLLNALVFQHRLARVSATPGRTRSINLYPVDGKWILVDLPGYGYAKVARSQREEFRELIMGYLLTRQQLVLACVLVDSRHDPTADDLALLEELEMHARRYAVILTKIDALSQRQLVERQEQLNALIAQCRWCAGVISTSTRTGVGRDKLWSLIMNYVTTFHHPHRRTQ